MLTATIISIIASFFILVIQTKAQAAQPMVAAGTDWTVGLMSDGTAVAVGNNNVGQLEVNSWSDIFQIDAGGATVGLKSDGTVCAVGCNLLSEQCDVTSWTNIMQVAAGACTVGLKTDGTVVAVGDNSWGNCDVNGWTDIVQVDAGPHSTVGLKSNGTVVAIGGDAYGRLDVGSWTNIVQVVAGENHTVGLKSDGTVVAVGANFQGQLNVAGWTDIVQVASGWRHTVGLKSDGTVVAAGINSAGECDVSGWTDIVQLAAGYSHTVGLKSDGTVVAVGRNVEGQCDVYRWNLLSGLSTISISIPSSAKEGDGVLSGQGSVSMSWAIPIDLTLSLESSDMTEVTVPATVVIPQGSTSADFDLTIVDDTDIDGTQTITITVSATNWGSENDTIDIQDSSELATISIPFSATEGYGVLVDQGVVTISMVNGADLTISLVSSDNTEVTVPASVVIPQGSTSANFDLTIVDDTDVDGTQTTTVTASAPGLGSVSDTIFVYDNWELTAISIPASATEGDGVLVDQGTVTISQADGFDLNISLSSSNTNIVTVPAAVVIPQGSTSANFDLTILDDTIFNGTQTVTIMASVPGLGSASDTIVIEENDVDNNFDLADLENLGYEVSVELLRARDPGYQYGRWLCATNDKNLIALSTNGTNHYFLKIDKSGNVIDSKPAPGPDISGIAQRSDGDFFVVYGDVLQGQLGNLTKRYTEWQVPRGLVAYGNAIYGVHASSRWGQPSGTHVIYSNDNFSTLFNFSTDLYDIAFDSFGIMYVSDLSTDSIYMIDASYIVYLLLDGLSYPKGITMDNKDNLLIVDEQLDGGSIWLNKPNGDTFELIYNIGSHPNNVAYLDGSYYFAKADAVWEMEVISTADTSSDSGGGGGGG